MNTSATASATGSLITALGAGSGIDMAALASNLAAAQFAGRTDRLTARAETLDRQISAASDLKSMLLSLSTSLGDRVRMGDLSPQPQVANAAVAKATLSGTRTPTGSYALEVTRLASGQTLASPAIAAPAAPVGAGTLTLRFGTTGAGGFAEDTAHAPAVITIASGSTLADVAAAITGARAGVTAYVAQTPDGAKLVLKGAEGAANGFVLDAAETPGEEGLAALAWDGTPNPARLVASAADAAIKVDGLEISAKSNTVAEAIPGVTLRLTGTNAGAPTLVTFAEPASAITTAMQDLTAALNEISGALRTATDAKTGDLARDGGARSLRNAFAGLAGRVIMPGAAADAPRTFADIGLATERDGSFRLDTNRLAASLRSDPDAVAAMFTNGLYGVYATVDGISRAASRTGDPGALGGSIARYTTQKTAVTEDQADLAEKQETLRAQLTKRFAVSDSRIAASKATLSMLQNQIDAWNASLS